MRRMPLLFLFMLFTVTQAVAELEKDLVVYFCFDNVKGKRFSMHLATTLIPKSLQM